MASQGSNDEQKQDSSEGLHTSTGRASKLLPEYLVKFLWYLRHNGNVTVSAKLIGWSRTTIYTFANKNPSFKQAMQEAMIEGRELLIGEGWRRATEWSEHTDSKDRVHVTAPDNGMLKMLIQGYFQQFKSGHEPVNESLDALVPESADLTKLSDNELQSLEAILVKVGGNVNVAAGES